MAYWTVSDQLDARLRQRLDDKELSDYIESFFVDQLDYEEDQAYRSQVNEQIADSESDIAAGRVTDARAAMRQIATDQDLKLDR
ncbi:MAG: hypothetical protein AAF797_15315 [Planctomycetota bacterium]